VGLTADDLRSSRYFRVKHIQKLRESGELDSSLQWKTQGEGKCFSHADAHAIEAD
jgi:hypothetical protein